MVLLMVGLALIGLICSITAQYFAAKAAVGFAAGLKSALFRHIQSLPYSEMDHLGTASLITRMTSDVNQLQSGVNLVLRLFLRSPFIVFGAMVMAFTIDVRSALVFAVAIPLLSVVVFGIMLLTMPLYRRAQAGLDRLLRELRSPSSTEREYKAFFNEFDTVFLSIYPDFIEQINALLHETERLKSTKLNTEFRLLAVIRLGITDNAQIAQFLHISINTVYTYRNRLRNAATIPPQEFEKRILEIR